VVRVLICFIGLSELFMHCRRVCRTAAGGTLYGQCQAVHHLHVQGPSTASFSRHPCSASPRRSVSSPRPPAQSPPVQCPPHVPAGRTFEQKAPGTVLSSTLVLRGPTETSPSMRPKKCRSDGSLRKGMWNASREVQPTFFPALSLKVTEQPSAEV
jgi:hypothetical protein